MAEKRVNPIALLRRTIKAHHISRVVLVLSGIAAALLFFVAGAAVRLLIGPISLGPFAGTLADAMDRAMPGISVKYDQAAIEWERDVGRVNLVILGTRVFDRSGRIIAQAPKAEVYLAAVPFLHGEIDVKRIDLVGVQLTMVRTLDGGLRLGIGSDRQEEDILKRISDALKKNNGGTSSLESFAVRGARLAFYDESSRLFVVAPWSNFRLTRVADHLVANIDAQIEISGRPAHVKADLALPANPGGPLSGTFAISGFAVHSLAANSPSFAAVKGTALTLDLNGRFTMLHGDIQSADFAANAAGAVTIPDIRDGLVKVSSLKAVGHYDGVRRSVVLDDAVIEADKLKATLKGRLAFDTGANGELSQLRGELRMNRLQLALKGVFAEPVQFQAVELEAAWKRTEHELAIARVAVNGAPMMLQGAGTIRFAGQASPAVEFKGTIAPMNVRDLIRYWPVGAAAGGRQWVDLNMPAGTIGPTAFELHFASGMLDGPSLPPEAISVKFTVEKTEINYIKGLTHMTGVRGSAVVTGTSFTADVASGRIGPLAVNNAHFVIPDFNAAEEVGIVTGRIQGTMPDVLALVDMGNLRYPTRFGINTASSKGDTAVDVNIRVPMAKAVTMDTVAIDIKASATGFALALGPHVVVTDGTLNFQIDNDHLRALGTAGLGNSPGRLNLDWLEDFKTSKAITTTIAIKGTLDDAARTALNVGLKDYLKGPIGVKGTLVGHRGALTQGNLALDLTPTNVVLDIFGVNKPSGFPMTANLTMAFGQKSALDTQTVRISGPGTSVNASMKFEPGGRLVQLQAPNVRLGPQNDFSFTMSRGNFGTELVLRGRSLDGSRLGRRGASGNDDEKFEEPFHINARLDRVALRENVALTNFNFDMTGVAERPATANLVANLGKASTLKLTIGPSGDGRRIALSTTDMGTLLQGLYGFGSIKGGKLDVDAMLNGRAEQSVPASADAPDFQGKATLKEFRVLNQPFLAKMFSAGSLGGLTNLLQGQGIEVDSLDVPFSSRNNVISIHDVRATGPAIGISADGYIDRPKNMIAVKGSLVPLFGLNSVLGNIPLIGTVITSKEGEGIIGMTYSVSGVADEPNVSVNPLSALAPGILRRIFEGKMPNAANAPSNAPAAAAPGPAAAPPTPSAKPQPKAGQ